VEIKKLLESREQEECSFKPKVTTRPVSGNLTIKENIKPKKETSTAHNFKPTINKKSERIVKEN